MSLFNILLYFIFSYFLVSFSLPCNYIHFFYQCPYLCFILGCEMKYIQHHSLYPLAFLCPHSSTDLHSEVAARLCYPSPQTPSMAFPLSLQKVPPPCQDLVGSASSQPRVLFSDVLPFHSRYAHLPPSSHHLPSSLFLQISP